MELLNQHHTVIGLTILLQLQIKTSLPSSLRSPEGGADVGEVVKLMAIYFNVTKIGIWVGGGQKHTAGFDAPIGWEGEE